jgi:mercuric ion transport protein
MKKTSLSTVAGIITAIVASMCCIGPAFVALVGIGSIGAFTVFEAYRTYLISATILLLGIVFYFVYRKREIHCEDGTCKTQDSGKWNKISVWSATFVAVVAIGFPHLGVAPSISENINVQGKPVVTLNVVGMDCKPCALGLEGSLASIHGVHKAQVDFEKGEAIIEYDPAMSKPEIFVERIKANGFSATIKKEKGI